MWDWLLSAVDASRTHEVGTAVSWHARSMVLAWGIIAPIAVILTRFFKITKRQNWPEQLDNQFWWHCHLVGQTSVVVLSVVGFALIYLNTAGPVNLHGWMGYTILLGMAVQVLLGLGRGSKGGPTDLRQDGSPDGDHFDMTRWRLFFEAAHKTVGYGIILLSVVVILLGMWTANAPRWMWLSLAIWWPCLAVLFMILQKRGQAVDTYQAIWGPDPDLPGNRRPPQGWGMRRPGDTDVDAASMTKGDAYVRSDRRSRVRSP